MLKKRSKICEGGPYPLAEWGGGGCPNPRGSKSAVTPGTVSNALNTQNRMTFLNKHLILFKSLIESFGGGCVKIFDGRAFSLFETVPSCRETVPSYFIWFEKPPAEKSNFTSKNNNSRIGNFANTHSGKWIKALRILASIKKVDILKVCKALHTLSGVAEIRAEIVWDSDERMAAKIALNEAVFFFFRFAAEVSRMLAKRKNKEQKFSSSVIISLMSDLNLFILGLFSYSARSER